MLLRVGPELTTAELDAFERAKATRFVADGPGEDQRAVERLVKEFRMPEPDALEAVSLVRAPENPGEFTVWGMVNGITSACKGRAYAADRMTQAQGSARLMV